MKEELGDILFNSLFVLYIAKKEGHFTIKEIIKSVYEKLKELKPFVLKEKQVSLLEEIEYYDKAKQNQKNKKTNN